MAKTIVPNGLREFLNTKLKQEGWSSVRNFAFATGLCNEADGYSAETITRVFNARVGESKGTEIITIANVMRYLNIPMAEIRNILEQYYPELKMFWSLLGTREIEISTIERSFLNLIQQIETTKPEKILGFISAIEAYTVAADIDCHSSIVRIRKLLKKND